MLAMVTAPNGMETSVREFGTRDDNSPSTRGGEGGEANGPRDRVRKGDRACHLPKKSYHYVGVDQESSTWVLPSSQFETLVTYDDEEVKRSLSETDIDGADIRGPEHLSYPYSSASCPLLLTSLLESHPDVSRVISDEPPLLFSVRHHCHIPTSANRMRG